VLAALTGPMINHRGPAWEALFAEVEAGLQWVFATQQRVLALAGSGTTGMEAALVNLFSPGDRVLALANGSFGERFADMARRYGLEVTLLAAAWGEPLDLVAFEAALAAQPDLKAVLVVHNETSTGRLNPLAQIAALTRAHGALLIVDAISSLTSTPLPMDAWGLDVVLGASQKGLMVPPGLAFVALSERAWAAHRQARLPRYTLDFSLALEYAQQGWTPWTPPISLFYGLQAALGLMRAEGLAAIQARHLALQQQVRQGARALGLELMISDEAQASRSVTPIFPPPGLSADAIRDHLRTQHQVVVGGGQRRLSGQIFRIGHLGWQHADTVGHAMAALAATLQALMVVGRR
jgi:aspartate aminotransferase-like enzyme